MTLRAERIRKHEAIIDRGALGVRVFARRAAPPSEWFEFLAGWYVLGLIPAVFSFRRSWATYDRQFPILPNRVLKPHAYQAAAIAKGLLFAVLLPFSVGFVTLVILLGFGWREREGYF